MTAVDDLLLTGFDTDGLCRRCRRTRIQHGRLRCAQIDAIEAQQARDRMSRWGRLAARVTTTKRARRTT